MSDPNNIWAPPAMQVAARPAPPSKPSSWLPDMGAAVAVMAVAVVFPFSSSQLWNGYTALSVTLGMAAACLIARRFPLASLALVWFTCGIQVLAPTYFQLAQFSVMWVAYACTRYGKVLTMWLSGLSIPAGLMTAASFAYAHREQARPLRDLLLTLLLTVPGQLAAIGITVGPLLLPWVLGLIIRLRSSAAAAKVAQAQARARELDAQTRQHQAEAHAQQADQLARAQARNAQLARDVHDVVGHSLAVILAQAESAQFLASDDVAGLRTTMANIADSARSSLVDVRQVLSATMADKAAPAPSGGWDALIDSVRAAGTKVEETERGSPRPLPPELATVAYRVCQEMLTNALKHGARGAPIELERIWADQLIITVTNAVVPGAQRGTGYGLVGMQRRLEAVGGRMSFEHNIQYARTTAWVPLRPTPSKGPS